MLVLHVLNVDVTLDIQRTGAYFHISECFSSAFDALPCRAHRHPSSAYGCKHDFCALHLYITHYTHMKQTFLRAVTAPIFSPSPSVRTTIHPHPLASCVCCRRHILTYSTCERVDRLMRSQTLHNRKRHSRAVPAVVVVVVERRATCVSNRFASFRSSSSRAYYSHT